MSLGSVLSATAWVVYPVAVYFALRMGSPRMAAGVLACALLPGAYARLRRAPPAALRSLSWLPLVLLFTLGVSALLDSRGLLLSVPVAISSVFLLVFALSLHRGPPMVERFARLIDADLTAREVAWCRLWTGIWCGFFSFNALVSAALAWLADVTWWAAYTGLGSYLLMGTLFGTEYTLRKYRFGRLGQGLLDRTLASVFARCGGGSR